MFDKVIGKKREKAAVSHTERFVGECENMKKIYAEVMTNVELNLHEQYAQGEIKAKIIFCCKLKFRGQSRQNSHSGQQS